MHQSTHQAETAGLNVRVTTVHRVDLISSRGSARLIRNEFFKGEWSTELDFAMLADEWYTRQKE